MYQHDNICRIIVLPISYDQGKWRIGILYYDNKKQYW